MKTPRRPISKILAGLFFAGLLWQAALPADGLIIVNDPQNPWSLRVKFHRVETKINDLTAETFVDQEFENPTDRRLEGTYLFPVPRAAAIRKFSMFIDGREMQAELLPADKARNIYEEIVRRQKDPALLEYAGRDLFKVRIFPIEPRSTKRVKISYAETLSRDSGTVEYTYPLSTEKFSSADVGEISVRIDITSSDRIGPVLCSGMENSASKIDKDGANHCVVTFSGRNIRPRQDVTVSFGTSRTGPGSLFQAHRQAGEDGTFRLNISPDTSGRDIPSVPKDITFVLDTSGSMAGAKLEQARQALLYCVRSLNPDDRFEVIRFSTEAEALFSKLTSADKENVRTAENFIAGFAAAGGTHISDALDLALSAKKTEGRSRVIVFITDGKPTVGETAEDALIGLVRKDAEPGTRIFTFGVGYDLNTHLLDRIAEETRAARAYVAPEEDIEVKVSGFYQKIRDPVLTDLSLSFEGGVKISKTYPSPSGLPDLFKDTDLSVVGRYQGSGTAKAVLEGTMNGKRQRFEFEVNFPSEEKGNELLPLFWATKRVAFLLDQIRLHGSEQELVDEVTALARKFGIVTPYTSWLILEDEARQVQNNRMDRDLQIFNGIAPAPRPAAVEESRKRFENMKEKSGAGSVKASRAIQTLMSAPDGYASYDAPAEGEPAEKRMVNGRMFFRTAGGWVDSGIRTLNNATVIRFKFGSDEYFQFLHDQPSAAVYLSLGGNVRFIHEGRIYIVSQE